MRIGSSWPAATTHPVKQPAATDRYRRPMLMPAGRRKLPTASTAGRPKATPKDCSHPQEHFVIGGSLGAGLAQGLGATAVMSLRIEDEAQGGPRGEASVFFGWPRHEAESKRSYRAVVETTLPPMEIQDVIREAPAAVPFRGSYGGEEMPATATDEDLVTPPTTDLPIHFSAPEQATMPVVTQRQGHGTLRGGSCACRGDPSVLPVGETAETSGAREFPADFFVSARSFYLGVV